MTTRTPEEVRAVLARDYARRAKSGDDLGGLFEVALDEGYLEGMADAVEAAIGQGHTDFANRLRAMVMRRVKPRPLAARPSAPSTGGGG